MTSYYDLCPTPSYAALFEFKDKRKKENFKTENILEGLENYNPMDSKYRPHITQLTLLAAQQTDPTIRMVMDHFLDNYKNETRIHRTVDEQDPYGRSPLHWMVGNQNELGYQRLLHWDAKLESPTMLEGFTPLMVACRKGNDKRHLLNLIARGADVNMRAYSSATPFHIATAGGNRSAMRALVIHGADPRAAMRDGRTAYDFAADEKTRRVIHTCLRSFTLRQERQASSCSKCGAPALKNCAKRCAGCYVTFYCNQKCQSEDWRDNHRTSCPGSVIATPAQLPAKHKNNKHAETEEQKLPFKPRPIDINAHDDKTFAVEAYAGLSVEGGTEEEIIKVINVVKGVRMRVAAEDKDDRRFRDFLDFVVKHGRGERLSVYFWARFNNEEKSELSVYYGRDLVRQEMEEGEEQIQEREKRQAEKQKVLEKELEKQRILEEEHQQEYMKVVKMPALELLEMI